MSYEIPDGFKSVAEAAEAAAKILRDVSTAYLDIAREGSTSTEEIPKN